uniref:Uncharacterized protein n=1 Tax=Vitis vinifera TaxID=29760 RepID=F6H582_VITVI
MELTSMDTIQKGRISKSQIWMLVEVSFIIPYL